MLSAISTQIQKYIPCHHVSKAVQLKPQRPAEHQLELVETRSAPSLKVGASSHLPTVAVAVAVAVVVVVVVVVAAVAAQSVIALEVLAPQMMTV
jgi:hypothetical protein